MKKILIILITIPLIFGSCEKEDESPNDINYTPGSILGTWYFSVGETSVNYGYIDPVFGTEIVTNTYSEIWSTDTMGSEVYIVFRYDNTGTEYIYEDSLMDSEDYSYVKEGNMLSITFNDGDIIDCQITTLTYNDLRFSWEDNNFNNTWTDTTYFEKRNYIRHLIKSELPSITTEPLNKKKPVNDYNSFLNRRENR